MTTHINNDGKFQSDKYPTCPADKVPLSVNDKSAQDLLWEYAARRQSVDAEFADDLRYRLWVVGYRPDHAPYSTWTPEAMRAAARAEPDGRLPYTAMTGREYLASLESEGA